MKRRKKKAKQPSLLSLKRQISKLKRNLSVQEDYNDELEKGIEKALRASDSDEMYDILQKI